MLRAILILASIAVILYLVVAAQPPARRRAWILGLATATLLMGLFYLGLTGRLHWLAVLFASILPFARRWLPLLRFVPMLRGLFGRQGGAGWSRPTSGRQSEVSTDWIRMTLDHDSGRMDGTVLKGDHQGRRLAELEFDALLELLDQLQTSDSQSAELLRTYLEREHAEQWDAHAASDTGHRAGDTGAEAGIGDEAEAWLVLGLQPGASAEEIVDAHRRLMQKLHPDRGGSDYLAAKVNAAKALLLQKYGP